MFRRDSETRALWQQSKVPTGPGSNLGHGLKGTNAVAGSAGGIKPDLHRRGRRFQIVMCIWGDNTYGQLGDGTTTSNATPVLVSGGYTWATISTEVDTFRSGGHTCGVTTSGIGYCWGSDTYGELGNGTTGASHSAPALISGSHTWASINVGLTDTCGVTTTGAGYCWGYNFDGEDGDGTTFNNVSPILISGGYTWSELSTGNGTTCGVTTAGSGYCWGGGGTGQLGSGTTSAVQSTPAAVSGGYTWASITTEFQDSCGVTTSGTGYCWGENNAGQDGEGTTTERNTPTLVLGGYTWSAIQVNATTCGLTTGGAAYCWGWNGQGEIGDGTTTFRTSPTAVSGGLTFSSISTGDNWNDGDTNCGLALDGIIYCWGVNGYSQIGDGTTTDRHTPVAASLLYAITNNSTASATVDPSFTFTVANQASPCNGESNFASGAGTATSVALGHLAAGANASGGQSLSAAGNSGGGFAVYVRGTQASQNLRSAGHNWTDVTGSYASPAVVGAGERFGYTYNDSTASSSVTNPGSAKFVALDNAATNSVMGSSSSENGSGCVSYDAQTSATTPAASYSATIVYTAVPSF